MKDFLQKIVSSTDKTTIIGITLLPEPSLKHHERHDNSTINIAVSSMRGRRDTQEDAHAIDTQLRPRSSSPQNDDLDSTASLPNHALLAVFDGHGTSLASNFAAEHFIPIFCAQTSFLEYCRETNAGSQINDQKKGKVSKKKTRKNASSPPNPAFGRSMTKDPDGSFKLLLENAMKSAMIQLDAQILLEIQSRQNEQPCLNENDSMFDIFDSGTTAIIVLLTPQYIICANVGDSRAILQRGPYAAAAAADGCKSNNTICCLSTDHKPNNDSEKIRIENAGGVVLGGKIEGRLAVSRALGDFSFKHLNSVLSAAGCHDNNMHVTDSININDVDDNVNVNAMMVQPEDQMVTCIPEITTINRNDPQDKFLVIACDGIWDVLSNEQCAQLISCSFEEGEANIGLVCEELLDQCYAKGSLDNMTVIVVKFPLQDIGVGGGVMRRRKQRMAK